MKRFEEKAKRLRSDADLRAIFLKKKTGKVPVTVLDDGFYEGYMDYEESIFGKEKKEG